MTSDERKRKIREMWKSDYTGSEIAKVVKISRNAVMGHIHRMVKNGELQLKDPTKQAAVKQKAKMPYKQPTKTVQQIFSERPLDIYFDHITSVTTSKNAVSLMELSPTSCRFAVSGTVGSEYLFCNNPIEKVSYCAEHYKLCYTPLTKSKTKFRYQFR